MLRPRRCLNSARPGAEGTEQGRCHAPAPPPLPRAPGVPARSPPPRGDRNPVFLGLKEPGPPPGEAAPGSAPCLAQRRPRRAAGDCASLAGRRLWPRFSCRRRCSCPARGAGGGCVAPSPRQGSATGRLPRVTRLRCHPQLGENGAKPPRGFIKFGPETPGAGEAAAPGDPKPTEPRLPRGAGGQEPPPFPRWVPSRCARRPAGIAAEFGRGLEPRGRCLHSKQLVNVQQGRAREAPRCPRRSLHNPLTAPGSPGCCPHTGAGPRPLRVPPLRVLGAAAASSWAAPAPVPAAPGSAAAPPVFPGAPPAACGLLPGSGPVWPRRDPAGGGSRIPGP